MNKQIIIASNNNFIDFTVTENNNTDTLTYPKPYCILYNVGEYFQVRNMQQNVLFNFNIREIITINGESPTNHTDLHDKLKNAFYFIITDVTDIRKNIEKISNDLISLNQETKQEISKALENFISSQKEINKTINAFKKNNNENDNKIIENIKQFKELYDLKEKQTNENIESSLRILKEEKEKLIEQINLKLDKNTKEVISLFNENIQKLADEIYEMKKVTVECNRQISKLNLTMNDFIKIYNENNKGVFSSLFSKKK